MAHWETSGASDEWYTPKYIFDALGTVFDLDVAAPNDGPLHVPASRWFSTNALEQDWSGFVWMNPPFGGRNSLAPWMAKFFDHGNGIALTPDRTSAPWFQDAWDRAGMVLFTPKVRFLRPDGSEGVSPSNGTALWAAGEHACRCLIHAAERHLGILARPLTRSAESHTPALDGRREGSSAFPALPATTVSKVPHSSLANLGAQRDHG